MKSLSVVAVIVAAALGAAVVTAQETGRARVQPLLGFGSNPTPAGGGSGSSADAFFDDSVLQEIRLTINSKDWQTLKDNYLSNEYYPCDFRVTRPDHRETSEHT